MLSLIGCVLLLHAAYSSYEHHQVLKTTSTVPRDIVFEVVLGLIAMNFGAIKNLTNTDRLSINNAARVSPTEKYLEPIKLAQAMSALHDVGISEYDNLESRVDFMDIRGKRNDHMAWSRTYN